MHFFKQIFDLKAKRIYSDFQIVDIINASGYRSKERNKWSKDYKSVVGKGGGVLMSVKKLNEIIEDPIFAGILVHTWNRKKPIKAIGTPILDIAQFNEANNSKIYILENIDGTVEIKKNYNPKKAKEKIKHNPLYPYKNAVLCSECKGNFWASTAKGGSGKYSAYYHCQRGHKYYGITTEIFEAEIEKYLSEIGFTEKFTEKLRVALVDTYRAKSGELAGQSSQVSLSLSELLAKKNTLVDQFIATDNKNIKDSIESRIDDLEVEIINAKKIRKEVEYKEETVEEFIRYSKKFISNPSELFLEHKKDPRNIEVLASLVFKGKPTYNEILTRTAQLSCVFKLKSSIASGKSDFVGDRGLEPLTFAV